MCNLLFTSKVTNMKTTCFFLCLLGFTFSVPVEQISSFYNGPNEFNEDFPEENPGLFEGDIVLREDENPMDRNSITNKRRKLWPNGVVPYIFSSGYSSSEEAFIRNGMKTIEEKTRVNGKACITFTPHTTETEYINFHPLGCGSPVGMGHGMQYLYLDKGCHGIGSVMHEMYHALGTWHEQSRHDRDNYVTIDFSNIGSGQEQFEKFKLGQIDELGMPYDYESVMHYGPFAYAQDRTKPTITPKQRGAVIGQRTHLSPIDIKEMQILYGCIPRPTSTGGEVTPVPFVVTDDACTFDEGMCGWTNEEGSLTWAVREGKTPSANTGPETDHSGSANGHYLYVESSGHLNQSAFLSSPQFISGNGQYCLDFYYYMYGDAMGYLEVHIVFEEYMMLWHILTGDNGQRWSRYRSNIHVTQGIYQILLEGHIGTSDTSYIAIDDLFFHEGKC